MTILDCSRLHGRFREICEGRSGLAPEVEEQYRQLWASESPVEQPRRVRLGDAVAWLLLKLARGDEERTKQIGRRFDLWLAWASRGKFQPPEEGCNCDSRREWLNRLGFQIVDRLYGILTVDPSGATTKRGVPFTE